MGKLMSPKEKIRNKFYKSGEWQRARRKVLLPGTPCHVCETVLATAVHHIKSPFTHTGVDLDLAYDINNLQPICRQCHGDVHGKVIRCKFCMNKLEGGLCLWCQETRNITSQEKTR